MSDDFVPDPGYRLDGFEAAGGFSTVGYRPRGPRSKNCKANKDTCKGFKVKGSDFCAGHLRSASAPKIEKNDELPT